MMQEAVVGSQVERQEDNVTMQTEEGVASLLKRTRTEKGLSLRDVEVATRIPAHYVKWLEGEGDARLLADALYLVPFLRTYSTFLALDPAETVALFIAGMQKELAQGQELPLPVPSSSRTAMVVVILVGLVVLSLFWVMNQQGQLSWQ
jgi:cytoskeletal protein RodZ